MFSQPFQPRKFIFELGPRLRIPVGRIDAADQDAADRRLDVAALLVRRISGKRVARDDRLSAPGKDANAIPSLLALPDRVIAGSVYRIQWKIGLRRFKLLE